MKAFLLAGTLACILYASACQSSKDGSSTDGKESKVADSKSDSSVFLAQLEEIQKIATEPTSNTVARNDRALARIREFNKAYPTLMPISRDSIQKVFKSPLPKEFGYQPYKSNVYSSRPTGIETSYEQPVPFEELIPNVHFPVDHDHLTNRVCYLDTYGRPIFIMVIDRGYLGGWTRAAHWYYLTRFFIGSERKPFFYTQIRYDGDKDPLPYTTKNYQGIFNKTPPDLYGHIWAGWERHPITTKGIRDMRSWETATTLSYWKDRWQVVIESNDYSGFLATDIYNPAWLKTVQ